MCGRFNVSDDPAIQALCDLLGIDISNWPIRYSADVAPGARVSIIREDEQGRRVDDAIWWLLLEQQTAGWKPNYKYASFNTRHDKLNKKGSAGYQAYRTSRCIIPASGFVEGLEGTKTYHQLDGSGGGIAFGGLYRTWLDKRTGELTLSTSIITLPPHPRFKDIHGKSFPMMLDPADGATVDAWLNPMFDRTGIFDELLLPRIVTPLRATPIDRPGRRNPQGPAFEIEAD